MTLPEDVVEERAHSIKVQRAREARALARIRSALRTLADCRRKIARDAREHREAVEQLAKRGER